MAFTASCSDESPESQLFDVKVQLSVPADVKEMSLDQISVSLAQGEKVFNATTEASGIATFTVPAGIYSASASATHIVEGNAYYALNGVKENVIVDKTWNSDKPLALELVSSKTSQVIIKEVYTGGTTNPETQKAENTDNYLTLYNNSPVAVNLKNFGLAYSQNNANAPTTGFVVGGELTYANEDWIPASDGTFYFPSELTIEPYTDVVVVLRSAINHTLTNTASVDLSHADYVCYDPESGYNDANAYKAPSANIPTNHYLKAVKWGMMSYWFYSNQTPAFFIYQTPEGQTPKDYFADASLDVLPSPYLVVYKAKKISRSWILDAVDTYDIAFPADCYKRMTPDLDAGFVYNAYAKGYSMYRNVNKAATEAIAANKGKLVYDYALGTQDIENGSTDKSGIDAEASIKNGAKIVYMDTNNSTNDFHLRKECAQRTK